MGIEDSGTVHIMIESLISSVTVCLGYIINSIKADHKNLRHDIEIAKKRVDDECAVVAEALVQTRKEDEDGRRRIWDRLSVDSQLSADHRLTDAREYMTRNDFAAFEIRVGVNMAQMSTRFDSDMAEIKRRIDSDMAEIKRHIDDRFSDIVGVFTKLLAERPPVKGGGS